jgi:hypothetical protein
MMNQNEKKNKFQDQNGLLEVLKNIQNKACQINSLCIEIGEIKGLFKSIDPKNISYMRNQNQKENIQIVTRPILLINDTNIHINKIPVSPWIPNAKEAKKLNITNLNNLNDNLDCDLNSMGITSNTNKNIDTNINTNLNFIQRSFLQFKNKIKFISKYNKNNKKNNNENNNEIKTKFYRKLEYSKEILANDVFKQGINLIILNREKGYQKLYERTFNTNFDPIESDNLACKIRDTDYNKIIILNGIGKWTGAITPKLIKEIKQIGGPDLNKLLFINSQRETHEDEDNPEEKSFINNSFILIGRRGLCRYNGIFRIKNFDYSKEIKKFFPDLSSDPNDVYFENIDSENLNNLKNWKNKNNDFNSYEQFYHEINLRLNLNLEKDNRFSYKSPIIFSVNPSQGPILGNQKITIFGKNFGESILDIKEILIRGVICKYVEFISPEMITCFTGSSKIMGAGFGNAVINLFNGFSSPIETCNMYSYNPNIKPIPQSLSKSESQSQLQIQNKLNKRLGNENNYSDNSNTRSINDYNNKYLNNFENSSNEINSSGLDFENNYKNNLNSNSKQEFLKQMSFKQKDSYLDSDKINYGYNSKFSNENIGNGFNSAIANNGKNKNKIDFLNIDNFENIIGKANKVLGRSINNDNKIINKMSPKPNLEFNSNLNKFRDIFESSNKINDGFFKKKRFQNLFSHMK